MKMITDYRYNAIETAAVEALERAGFEPDCYSYGNATAKEVMINGLSVYLPNSKKENLEEEEYNTFMIPWDRHGTGRMIVYLQSIEGVIRFARECTHPDTHTDAEIDAFMLKIEAICTL